jgi:hypothetical protein
MNTSCSSFRLVAPRVARVGAVLACTWSLAPTAQAAEAEVPAGTKLLVRTRQAIDSNRMSSGAKFTVALESDLEADGTVVAKDGSVAYGVLANAKRDARVVGKSELTVTLTELKVGGKLLPIRTSGVKAVGEGKGRTTARRAAAGAAIGAIFGGGRGAAIGAGTAAASQLLLGGRQVSIPANTLLEFTLATPLRVAVDKPQPAAAAAGPAAAPTAIDPLTIAFNAAKVRAADDEAVLAYSWKQRTELRQSGKPILVRLDVLRFDFDGNLQRTTMNEELNQAGDKFSVLDQVRSLRAYGLPTSGSLVDFLQKAELTQGKGVVVATGANVHNPGDRITLSIDQKTHRLQKIDVSVTVDGESFEGNIDYRLVDDSMSLPVRAIVQVASKKLEVRIENFDFQK